MKSNVSHSELGFTGLMRPLGTCSKFSEVQQMGLWDSSSKSLPLLQGVCEKNIKGKV